MANFSISSGINGLTNSYTAVQNAFSQQETNKFQSLLDNMKESAGINTTPVDGTLASEQVILDGRLNGDYTSGFSGSFTSEADKNAAPTGAAANSSNMSLKTVSEKTIDKTSALYEKSLELESYLVKMMLNSMRSTISKTNLYGSENNYAQSMYEDMLYDEYATSLTKSAGFGIADQIYLELV